MTEKITVIVPAYNVEGYIKRCLDSILNSTYQNLEIIAINDGSSDRTGEILDTYKDNPRVVVIHQNNRIIIENDLINWDEVIEWIKEVDGRGIMASYDGIEMELENDLYGYRVF